MMESNRNLTLLAPMKPDESDHYINLEMEKFNVFPMSQNIVVADFSLDQVYPDEVLHDPQVVVKQNHPLEMLDGGQSEFKVQVIAGSTKSFVKNQYLEQHPVNEKSSSDSEDSEKKKKKRSRNKNIERRRRAELSSDFQSLRSLIPGLETADGATVRVILEKATSYCRSLTAEGEQQKVDLVSLKKEQKMLRRQITLLERQKRKNECVHK